MGTPGNFVNKSLGDCDAVEAGAAAAVEELRDASVTVSGTFVGTVAVQISHDGTEYVNAAAAVTAPAVITIPVCKSVRLNCTAFTSGVIKGRVGGVNPQLR